MLWWLQLQNYSIGWMVFVAIAVTAAAFGRWWIVIIGHCVLAVLVVVVALDFHWI